MVRTATADKALVVADNKVHLAAASKRHRAELTRQTGGLLQRAAPV